MAVHGADQSRAHAEAAKRLSEAKRRLSIAARNFWSYNSIGLPEFEEVEREYAAAKADEYVARQAYTNPFGIEKTS